MNRVAAAGLKKFTELCAASTSTVIVAAAKPHAVSISAPITPACKNPEYCPNSLRQANCSSARPSDAAVTSSPSHSLKADVFEIALNFSSAEQASIIGGNLLSATGGQS